MSEILKRQSPRMFTTNPLCTDFVRICTVLPAARPGQSSLYCPSRISAAARAGEQKTRKSCKVRALVCLLHTATATRTFCEGFA